MPKPDENSLNQFIRKVGNLMLNELSQTSNCFDGNKDFKNLIN